jgi:alpha-N-arabinofuranosidase
MNHMTINADLGRQTISRHIYGHFAEHLGRCIYGGIYVGEASPIPNTRGIRNDVAEALRNLNIPNLRWPGGCFADEYHWMDGIGSKARRPTMINTHWGGVTEDNSFGTHEFFELCDQLGCEPYICGNVGSGTVQEMQQWVEYITFDGISPMADLRRENGRDEPWRIKYWGVGNENWGCGGNMRPEYYADLYRRFATYCRDFGDNRLVRVACGPGGLNQNWTRVVMERAADHMQAFSLHFYTVYPSWQDKTPATGFGEKQWFAMLHECLQMEQAIDQTEEIMDRIDPKKRIELFVDEWGSWYRTEPGHPEYGLYQQNSLRDALLAGLTFHIFHEHNDRVKMANIAQVVNVLQAMILTDRERMLLTPTYHAFEMYKVHHDATRLPVELTSPTYEFGGQSMPALSVSASRDKEGVVHVSIVNTDAHEAVKLTAELPGVDAASVSGRILTSDKLDAHNTFDDPERLQPVAFAGAAIEDGELVVDVPPRSVTVLRLTK